MVTTRITMCTWCCFWFIIAVVKAVSVEDLDCDFEVDTCDWIMTNLTRTEYGSPIDPSGPEKAQQGKFYISFNPIEKPEGYQGDLFSLPVQATTSRYCLRFWYHMFGTTMGTLYVNYNFNELWSKSGNQLNTWHCAVIKLPTVNKDALIHFNAVRGSDIYSFIAIDTIEIFPPDVSCEQKVCESLTKQEATESTTYMSTAQETSTVPITQASEQETTPTPVTTGFEEYLPYVAGIPGGILVIGLVVLIVCLRRNKQKSLKRDERMQVRMHRGSESERYVRENFGHSYGEVYDELDENKMEDAYAQIEDTARDNVLGDSNYITPTYNGLANSAYESPFKASDDYEKPQTNVHRDEDYQDAHVGNHDIDDDYLHPQDTVSNGYVRRSQFPSSLEPSEDYETPVSNDGSFPR